MRAAASCAAVSILVNCPAALPQAPVSAAEVAQLVGDAHQSEDATKIITLGSRAEPDPWLVARILLRQGKWDAAALFADATSEGIRDPLFDYVVSRAGAEAPDPVSDVEAMLSTARGLGKGGQLKASLVEYDAAADKARRIGWLAGEARALKGAGDVQRLMPSGLRPAIEAWTRAAELEALVGRRKNQAVCLYYRGNAQGELGLFAPARESLQMAVELFEAAGHDRYEADATHSLGMVNAREGKPGRALLLYLSALDAARRGGDPITEAFLLLEIAETRRRLGDVAGSLDLARSGLEAWDELGGLSGRAQAHGTIGLAQAQAGDFDAALESFETAEELLRGAADQRALPFVHMNLGLVLMKVEDYPSAESEFVRALELSEAREDAWQEALAHFHLGRVYRRMGRFEEASLSDGLVLEIGARLQSTRLLMRGHLNVAKRLMAQGDARASFEAGQAAMSQMSQYVAGLGPEDGARARDYRRDSIETTLRAALEIGDPQAVLWSLEQSRSQALVEALGGRAAITSTVLDPDLLAKQQAAQDAERAAVLGLRQVPADDPSSLDAARSTLAAARQRVREVVQRIQRSRRAASAGVFEAPVAASELQATLSPSEAFVAFFDLDNEFNACVVTHEAVRLVRLGAAKQVLEAGLHVVTTAGNSRGISFESGSDEMSSSGSVAVLRQRLVDPLGLDETIERVHVSSNGLLAYVPFVVLIPDRDVVYIPSGTVRSMLHGRKPTLASEVLAVGDTVRPDLPRLPATRGEVEAIATRSLLGPEATQEQLELLIGSAGPLRAVHFACHSLVDPEDPLESELALTPGPSSDGRVTMLDVFGWTLDTDLVVLSACETGLGKVYKAEGVFGFTRAFLSTGARQVIVSLWKVDDEATRALMVRLYELWNPAEGDGLPLAAALRQAQEYVRSQPRWASTEYWAAWQLWGTGE